MGTVVMRAEDPLQRMRVICHGAPVLSPIRRNRSQQQHKKRENMISKKNSLVMGGFTLLKRGESIDESVQKKTNESLVVEPKKIFESVVVDNKPKKKKIEKKKNRDLIVGGTTVSDKSCLMYAGSGFVQSPDPNSLPLPSFSLKKKGVDDSVSVSATKDIRRILGLDGVSKSTASLIC